MVKLVVLFLMMISSIYATNVISIDSQITEDTFNMFKSKLESHKGKDVFIYINTDGGSMLASAEIVSLMHGSKDKKRFVCLARNARSGGFYIFMGCDVRKMTKSGELFLHNVRLINLHGDIFFVERYMSLIREVFNILEKATMLAMGIDEIEYRILSDSSTTWNYNEAMESKLIHGSGSVIVKFK